MTNFLEIDIKRLIRDPIASISRGSRFTTKELEDSIAEEGLQSPLWVRPGEDGLYLVINGSRRLTAMQKMGYSGDIPCVIKEASDDDVVHLVLASDQHAPFPFLALEDGKIAGGIVAISRHLSDRGYNNAQIGGEIGYTADSVGAMLLLYEEPPVLLERIANGDMAITVYSRMKTQPRELKLHLVTVVKPTGAISANLVRKLIHDWPTIWAGMRSADDVPEESDEEDDGQQAYFDVWNMGESDEPPVARCLNEAIGWLKKVDGRGLSRVDQEILGRLMAHVDKLADEYGVQSHEL